jgi:superfamily I DNA/RNA helicase
VIYKYYGPPGTGKTYKLISRAKAYHRTGTPLHKIGYFAFTRKAAEEAKKRMPAEENQIPYFQTFHSFAYKTLGINEENVMQPMHYQMLGNNLGIRIKFSDKNNKEETNYLRSDSEYFRIIQRAINKDTTVRHEYKIPKFYVIFIDEEQYLSPLQWMLYDVLKNYTKDIYLAGDDDQAIFAWAGADVDRFITEPAKEKVLIYSKRVSSTIQSESVKPISRIRGLRKPKVYYPRSDKGSSSYISNIEQVDLNKGKWLILTRIRSQANDIMKILKRKNYYYMHKKDKSYSVKLYKAIKNYNKWVSNPDSLDEKELKDILKYTDKTELKDKLDWYTLFTKAHEKEKYYIRSLLDKGENLDEDARIRVSTIHSIKGGEEDNVILSLHQGLKIQRSIRKSNEKRDEEDRVWYVGITRAKNNLYKLKTNNKLTEYNI